VLHLRIREFRPQVHRSARSMASPAPQILNAISAGDRSGADQLMELVYDDLRGLARAQMQATPPDHVLAPTGLVHEVFLKLAGADVDWRSRSHFFALGAKAMRYILVDYARESSAQKRGGNHQRIPLADDLVVSAKRDEDVLALDEALQALAEIDPERAEIVEMRFFGGMTIKEVAEATGKSARKVDKQWAATRIWLRKYLTEHA
jgi:RNA polymerase sigma-70 factor (ECF subfamily)